ncbi:MAG: hypothetical protein IJA65_01835 [Acholeplasmatales bacterium]|nr:hypothetical protein [Acholeplasmatales bacterium]
MFLDFNYTGFTYTCIFLIAFLISYFIILYSRLEELFKKGSIWPIRLAQIFIALIAAYLIASGIMSLINSTQI